MRDIRELYEMGDFDAIRQMLDEEEARAEQKLREAEEKARAEKEAKINEARTKLVAAAKEYVETMGFPMDESAIVRLVKSLSALEKVSKYGETPIIRVRTSDDRILEDFLRGRGL